MAHERVCIETTDIEQKKQHIERYLFACDHAKGKEILDIACGEGFGSHILAGAGSRKTIGVDISKEAIAKAKQKYKLDNLSYRVGNAQAMVSAPRSFDLIVSFETIEHLEYPKEHLSAVKRMLTRNGLYICSTPVRVRGTLNTKPKNPFHFREWDLAEFRALLSDFFEVIEVFGQSFSFIESAVPLNRTFLKILCRLVYKKEFQKFFKEKVTTFPRIPEFFHCIPQFQIAVCRKPLRL